MDGRRPQPGGWPVTAGRCRPAITAETDEAAREAREAKRQDLVRRVAAEIVENCLVTGSDSPVVADIKAELEEELGFRLAFAYPPEDQEMQLIRLGAAGPKEVTGGEKVAIIKRLWELALEKIDATML